MNDYIKALKDDIRDVVNQLPDTVREDCKQTITDLPNNVDELERILEFYSDMLYRIG